MGRSTGMALEKLSKGLVAVAESIAQLQLDIAKLDARVAAVDSQVVAIGKHLDRQLTQRADENIKRDLDLERAVFGQSRLI
jgi:site-specific recombinase